MKTIRAVPQIDHLVQGCGAIIRHAAAKRLTAIQ